jgi:hypothetical protein
MSLTYLNHTKSRSRRVGGQSKENQNKKRSRAISCLTSVIRWVKVKLMDVEAQPVLTKSFERSILGIHAAIARKLIIGIVSPAGVGFKFALRQVAKKHYLRIIVCDVSYAPNFKNVMLSIRRELCKVKFSRLDYNNVSLHSIVTSINESIKTSDINLLVLDNCDNLT